MKTNLSLKNFRIFDNLGASIDFKPITILTGCNSSGKSSVVKSLLFLKEFIKKATDELIRTGKYRPSQYNVEFTLPYLNLKSFDSTVNRLNKDKKIIISYTTCALIFDYKVELSFGRKESDVFNSAWLSSISIYSPDGSLILFAEVIRDTLYLKHLNLLDSHIMAEFLESAYAANILYIQGKKSECYDLYGEIIDQDSFNNWEKERISFLEFLDKGPGIRTSIFDIANMFNYRDFAKEYPALSGINHRYLQGLKHTVEDNLLFYFPVLVHLKGLNKKEACKYLSTVKIGNNVSLGDSKNEKLAMIIANDFENSAYDNFIDYYRDWENKELSNIIATQSDRITMCNSFQEGFIEGFEATTRISYDTWNGIHMFGSDSDSISFNKIYRFLTCWQLSDGISEDNEIMQVSYLSDSIQASHLVYDAMIDYLKIVLKKLFYPGFLSRLQYVGNFQSHVKRLYSFDDTTNNLGNSLKEYIALKGKLDSLHIAEKRFKGERKLYNPGFFMNKWIKKLDIGKKVLIEEDSDGLGAKLYIIKNGNRNKHPLADEGYGISQIVNFLLHIENEILTNKLSEDRITIGGFYIDGTPAISTPTATLAIEEPEVSLHPSLQSQLTNIFCDAYKNYGIEFIIETHSEYIIRRTQAIIANMKSKKEFDNRPFAVFYIENSGYAYELEYSQSGRFTNPFGKGFFDEASRSSIEVLRREKSLNYE